MYVYKYCFFTSLIHFFFYLQDRVEKSPSTSKDDKFERWLTKRKQTLEEEYQEMLNYEMKLKIWEREQQLKLPRSKFTKNIGV